MKILTLTLLLSSLSAFGQTFWDSDFPDHIDKFIYEEVHHKCALSDYVDSLIAVEEIQFEKGKTYIADFGMYGDIAQGFIAVDETFDGEIILADLECPRP